MPTGNVIFQVPPFVEEELYPLVDKDIEVIRYFGSDYMTDLLEKTREEGSDDFLDIVKKV